MEDYKKGFRDELFAPKAAPSSYKDGFPRVDKKKVVENWAGKLNPSNFDTSESSQHDSLKSSYAAAENNRYRPDKCNAALTSFPATIAAIKSNGVQIVEKQSEENLNIDGGLISNAYMDEWRNGSQCIGLEENTLSIVPVNTHEPLLTTYYKASDQQLISFMLKWPGEI
ncbi:hypothetical protein NC651_027809 [Populus alba x Populus x berolinensis]|nr:hypothetical protein NC651_027809 [Populus alba x Populus x berolinensis]